ncbi:WLM-domain-containing protein [Neoconidiobolus thromboides FSU 785]|nr:WLM-domain-containing protein [Neoconidiobolus thromboides FSU 785]
MESFNILVQYKGNSTSIQVISDSTVAYIKEQIALELQLEEKYLKLVYKRVLKDEERVDQTSLKDGSKVTLIATPIKDISNLQRVEKELYLRPKATVAPATPRKQVNFEEQKLSKYTFHKLETLSEFPNREKAYEFLLKLKQDLGVVEIMKKYQWQVGSLIELSPLKKEILGYNKNKGQVIALRLRTDDLTGFVNYNQVKKVLMHELAHMIHSEHDAKFHELNRTLNKEVIQLDWTKGKGSRTSNAKTYNPNNTYYSSHTANKDGHRLGGKKLDVNEFNTSLEFRRNLISNAIDLRLTKEEEELVEACGGNSEYSQ